MTEWLQEVTKRLAPVSETPELDAEVLLRSVCAIDSATLATRREASLDDMQLERLEDLIVRRCKGEPVAYLLRQKEFWSLTLRVTPATLIPRPETELLVDCTLDRVKSDADAKILDLGTGSGAIAIAIASERPRAQVSATDLSVHALDVARTNAKALGFESIEFLNGDWLNAVPGRHFDLIACNPPYVRSNDPNLELRHTKYEPRVALISGKDGMEALGEIVSQAPNALVAGGWLLLEHGHDQESAVHKLLSIAGFDSIVHYSDAGGKPRVSGGQICQ
jgi:release factor glutamine methyltransferase